MKASMKHLITLLTATACLINAEAQVKGSHETPELILRDSKNKITLPSPPLL